MDDESSKKKIVNAVEMRKLSVLSLRSKVTVYNVQNGKEVD